LDDVVIVTAVLQSRWLGLQSSMKQTAHSMISACELEFGSLLCVCCASSALKLDDMCKVDVVVCNLQVVQFRLMSLMIVLKSTTGNYCLPHKAFSNVSFMNAFFR